MINRSDIRKTKCVYVEWLDSSTSHGWQQESDSRNWGSSRIVSVGFVVKESDQEITLTTSVSDTANALAPVTIPKFAITKKKVLKP